MLTRSGLGATAVALALVVCGTWWRYEELVVAGTCLVVATAIAIWSARVRHPIEIVRTIVAPRVARGDPIRTIYRATNPHRRRSPAVTLVDSCDEQEARVELPAIGRRDRTEVTAAIPTRRRGVFLVGPLEIERLDPFGLAIGRRATGATAPIIVHPKVYRLQGPYGAMHTVEDEAVIRRAAADPLSGFVSLREYVDGDDPRLIHWPTSARMGTLMLREHVELRRPEFTVVLDTAATVATPDDFEEMVDVAASVAVHAIRSGVDVALRTTSRAYPGALRQLDRDTQVLDLLTPVTQSGAGTTAPLAEIFHGGLDHTTIVFVTGPQGPSSVMTHTERISAVRVGRHAGPAPGIALAVSNADEFVRRWRPWR